MPTLVLPTVTHGVGGRRCILVSWGFVATGGTCVVLTDTMPMGSAAVSREGCVCEHPASSLPTVAGDVVPFALASAVKCSLAALN